MGLSHSVPVFLDNKSGWNEKQVSEINKIVKTLRNSFESKAKQKTKEKPSTKKYSISKYSRVLNLKDYHYDDYCSFSFILNPSNMSEGIDYPLLELEGFLSNITFGGSHSDSNPSIFIDNLGYIFYKFSDKKHMIFFHCNSNDWPEDNGKRLQFSIYVAGRTK